MSKYTWTIGIADSPPRRWKKLEPLWEDEQLVASSSHTFLDVMTELCNTAIKNRREYDHGVGKHLWKMKITSLEDAMKPPRDPIDRFYGSDSEDEDEGEGRFSRSIILCPLDEEHEWAAEDGDFSEDSRTRMVSSNDKLSREFLPMGSIVEVTYDYGTPTTLYLKVLSVKEKSVTPLLQYFTLEADHDKMKRALSSIPAYALPKNQQVDHFFPNASRAFLGYYIPLFTTNKEAGSNLAPSAGKKVIGCTSLGLSGPHTFCTMENSTQSQDLLYAPAMFDLNELLEVVERAWLPREKKSDPDKLDRYRYDSIMRWTVPAYDDKTYEEVKKIHKESEPWGPKRILFRLRKRRKLSGFDFKKVFPKTYAMLRSGKYRWFQYKKGILRVIVGPGKGHDNRNFESSQVLKTWKYDFESFHDLLCVVEASWEHNGRELSPYAYLNEFDNVVKLPITPTLVTEKECTVISSCHDLKKLVTVLAITEDPNGKPILYSGHDDGTLTKWSLEEDTTIWSKQIYADGTEDSDRFTFCGLHVRDTPGVAGIVVRNDPANQNHHLVYTWSDMYEGYPHRDFENRGPATLRAWSSDDGKLIRSYRCDVGADADGNHAYPSISTVVFCKLYQEDRNMWVDSIVVGLFCLCNCLEYDENYSDFDENEASELSEGNILPFWENSHGRPMETWRGDPGLIRAMAVVEDKYLFTLSICPGHGFPRSIILWSLREPGIPLLRKDLQDPTRSVLRQFTTRLHEIEGVSIDGSNILIANTYAVEIAALTISEDEDGPSSIEIRGYGTIAQSPEMDGGFHGRMAMSRSRYSVVANEDSATAWIFDINDCADHEKLDRRRGCFRDFENEQYFDEEEHIYPGRDIAIGKVEFPLWGGCKPVRKRQKRNVRDDELWLKRGDEGERFGAGGPMAIAFRGRWIVAGFSNGTLSKAMLPEKFADRVSSGVVSSNHLTSCSHLPSDEWHQPVLECVENSDDETDYEDY